jgi:FlaA1/EpsC-like NDP-sugar epimerase
MTHLTITWVDLFTWLFLIANAGRVLAYMPQIAAAWKCTSGAKSVSLLTWSYFTFAHLTALMYALVVLQDSKSAWVFAGNLSFTVLLVALLIFKRIQHRRRAGAVATIGAGKARSEMRKALRRAQSLARTNPTGLDSAKLLRYQVNSRSKV